MTSFYLIYAFKSTISKESHSNLLGVRAAIHEFRKDTTQPITRATKRETFFVLLRG